MKKKYLIILYISLIFLYNNSYLLSENKIALSSEKQLEFAKYYFDKDQYYRAISEYERFLFFFKNSSYVEFAHYQIGMCYYKSDHLDEAINKFQQIIQSDQINDIRIKAFFMNSKCHEQKKQWDIAASILFDLISLCNDIDIKDKAFYRIGWIYVQKNEIKEAKKIFNKISRNNTNKYKIDLITKKINDFKLVKKKSPLVAQILSIIPGAGHLYCNRYRDALLSFIVNTSIIYAAYESFDNGNNGLGSIIAFFGSGFYFGNIYSGTSSAYKYNLRQKEILIFKLKNEYYVEE